MPLHDRRSMLPLSSLILGCVCAAPLPASAQTSPDEHDELTDLWSGRTQDTEASAEERDLRWSLGGTVRPRYEARQVDDTWRELSSYRVDLSAVAQLHGVTVFVQPRAAGVYGLTGGDETTDPLLGVHRAYASYRRPIGEGGVVEAQAGRFALSYGEGRIFAMARWNQTGRTFDAVRTKLAPLDWLQVDGVIAKIDERSAIPVLPTGAVPAVGQDGFLFTMYAQVRPQREESILRESDLYVLRNLDVSPPPPGADDPVADPPISSNGPVRRRTDSIGTRHRFVFGDFDAVAEGTLQIGRRCELLPEGSECTSDQDEVEEQDYRAGMADATLGWNAPSMPLRLEAGGMIASGDDPDTEENEAYDPLYAAGHRHLGLADVFVRRDLIEARAQAGYSRGLWGIEVQGHHFWAESTGDARAFEVDLTATWRPVKILTVQGGYSLVEPTGDGEDTPHVHFGYVQISAAISAL